MRLHPYVLLLAVCTAGELVVPSPSLATPPAPQPVRLTCLSSRAEDLERLEGPAGSFDGEAFSPTTKLRGRPVFALDQAFSITTRLKAEIALNLPSCGAPVANPSTDVGTASIAQPDPLVPLINDLRRQAGKAPLGPLPETLRREILESYIRPLVTPMLQGAPCEHDLAAWQRLQDWGVARGFRPQSELFTCRRASGGGWEKEVIELWRQSPIHYRILLRDADALSCHRRDVGGKEFGVCITWRQTTQPRGTGPDPVVPSSR